MTDGRDDVSDRLANRFDSGDDDERSEKSSNDTKSQRSVSAKNVKKAWNAKTIYLPDDLDNELSKQFKRLDLELDDDLDLKKTRHFYPLIVKEGLERIENMERNELLERIE